MERPDILKALSGVVEKGIAATNIASILEQPEVDAVVAHLIDYQNPFRQNLPRRPGSGAAYLSNTRTAGNTPAQFVADTDTLMEDTGTYGRIPWTYKTIATRGKITRKAQKIGMSLLDIMAEELEGKSEDFRNYEEWAIIYGNSSTATQFDGLDKIFVVTTPGAQCVAMTTTSGGQALSLTKLDQAIDKCALPPNMLVMSRRTRRQLRTLLQASQRFVNTVEVVGGFKVLSYDDIPVFVSTQILDTYTFNGTADSASTGGTCTNLYALNTADCFMSVLTDVTVEPLAKDSSQYQQFDIYEDVALVMKNIKKHVCLIGIKDS